MELSSEVLTLVQPFPFISSDLSSDCFEVGIELKSDTHLEGPYVKIVSKSNSETHTPLTHSENEFGRGGAGAPQRQKDRIGIFSESQSMNQLSAVAVKSK